MNGVSVIIPTFNREKFVGKAIESVLEQDFEGEIEIIVSDDGSLDRTVEIAQSYGSKIKILLKPNFCKTQGASGARNRALQISTKPYICFLDSDDFFLQGHINKMTKAIESHPDVGFAFCRILELDESRSSKKYRLWTKEIITEKDISNVAVSKHNVVQTNGFIFRKEVFVKAGIFNENYSNGEDIDLWMRISELYKGIFSDHFGAVIRRHGSNHLTDNSKEAIMECHYKIFRAALKRYFSLGISDNYRLIKLLLLFTKYKLGRIKIFHKMYPYYYNSRNKLKKETYQWYSLSHFIN